MCEFEEICEEMVKMAERKEISPVVFCILNQYNVVITIPPFRNHEEKIEAFEGAKEVIRELGLNPKAIIVFLEGVEKEKGKEFLFALFFSPTQKRYRIWEILKEEGKRKLREVSMKSLELKEHIDFSDFFHKPNYIT